MIGGPSERDRQAQGAQPRIDEIEQHRVFQREQTGEPGIVGVAHGQARLEAIDVAVGGELRRREPKLPRRRDVFRVVDDQIGPARLHERQIEGARLGRRPSGRSDDDLDVSGQVERDEARQGLAVAPLDHELDVQFTLGIIERVQRADELRNDLLLAIGRDDDGIDRQFLVGETARPPLLGVRHRRQRPEPDRRQEQDPQHGGGDRRQGPGARGRERRPERGDEPDRGDLPARQSGPGGERDGEARERPVEDVAGALRANERVEPLRRRDREALGTQAPRQRHVDQPGNHRRARRDHRPGAAVRRGERGDPAAQGLGGLEVLGETGRAEIIGAAEPARQRAVVAFLVDCARGENGVERTDVGGRARDCGHERIERRPRFDRDLEFGRDRAVRRPRRRQAATRRAHELRPARLGASRPLRPSLHRVTRRALMRPER
ncbi:hypothetical protein DFR50_12418 [Roseiarcus fermentans]|uniref:Uncharacterized protein n=1 Tax=Roseiarcus fermentans TaxID=1473586 RepID=A0A366F1T7_9HYPH|nr:hypothetical protein DFR50_12418 [Roseiarcus fermentans]